MIKIAFCVSGAGRVVDAIFAARSAGLLNLEGGRIVIDRVSPAIDVARKHAVPYLIIDCAPHPEKDVYRQALADALCKLPVDGLFLTFDWLLPAVVVRKFDPHLVNLHMSLLPLFKGRGAVEAAIKSPMTLAGVSYHRVNDKMDEGPVIAQAITPMKIGISASELGFDLFSRALPLGIQVARWFESGGLGETVGGRVLVADAEFDEGPFFPRIDEDIAAFAKQYIRDNYTKA